MGYKLIIGVRKMRTFSPRPSYRLICTLHPFVATPARPFHVLVASMARKYHPVRHRGGRCTSKTFKRECKRHIPIRTNINKQDSPHSSSSLWGMGTWIGLKPHKHMRTWRLKVKFYHMAHWQEAQIDILTQSSYSVVVSVTETAIGIPKMHLRGASKMTYWEFVTRRR
jgi:hypothetical protein